MSGIEKYMRGSGIYERTWWLVYRNGTVHLPLDDSDTLDLSETVKPLVAGYRYKVVLVVM